MNTNTSVAPATQVEVDKRSYIGGSDVAAIVLGRNRWKDDPFTVWARLTGLAPQRERDAETLERLEMGHLMEPVVSLKAEKRLGVKLREVPLLVHPSLGWLGVHIDREAVDGSTDVELKTVEWDRDGVWSEEGAAQRVPDEHFLQVVTYIGVRHAMKQTRPHRIAAQFGLRELRMYEFFPDKQILAIWENVAARLADFYEKHVRAGDPPPVGASEVADAWLKRAFPKNESEEMIWDGEAKARELCRAYVEARKREKDAETEKEAFGNEIARIIGKKYGLEGQADGVKWRASWPFIEPQVEHVTDYATLLAAMASKHGFEVTAEDIGRHTKPVTVRQGNRRIYVSTKEGKGR